MECAVLDSRPFYQYGRSVWKREDNTKLCEKARAEVQTDTSLPAQAIRFLSETLQLDCGSSHCNILWWYLSIGPRTVVALIGVRYYNSVCLYLMYMYTVKTAAAELGLSTNQVRYLLEKGELKGHKRGRYWIVEELNYTRRRRGKIKNGRIKVSSKQIELLVSLRDGWKLINLQPERRHCMGMGCNHRVGMFAIKLTSGDITLINLKRMAKANEVDQAIKKRLPYRIVLSKGCEKYIEDLVKLINSCGSCLPYPTHEIEWNCWGYPRIEKCCDLYYAILPGINAVAREFRNLTVYRLENEGLISENSAGDWTLTKKGKKVLKEQSYILVKA